MGSRYRNTATSTVRDVDHLNIVMADDDRDDQLLVMLAAEEAGLNASFTFLDNGVELMSYLDQRVDVADLPNLIVLDLRMPVLDGHRTLGALQRHPDLWNIPVVIFTSSTRHSDKFKSLEGGARWFETKPSEFKELVSVVSTFGERAVTGSRGTHGVDGGSRQAEPHILPGHSDLTIGDLRS